MIHGYFSPSRDWPVPYVKVGVLLVDMTDTWRSVEFLLDTGSAITSLQPRDAMARWGFSPDQLRDPSNWPPAQPMHGIGGSLDHYPVRCRYAFDDDEDGTEYLMGQIFIARFEPAHQRLPSVLGWDVLRRFRFQFDHQTDTVSLRLRS